MTARKILAFALLGALLSAGFATGAAAKLPPPTDEQKAKAEEAKVKAAAADKKDAELLAKAQDRVAAHYIEEQKKLGKTVTPTPIAAAAPPAAPPAAVPMTAQQKAPNNAQTATPHNAETGNAGKDKPASKTDKPVQPQKPTPAK